jgi:triacylglycerol esterase/lipase EstA (alpha/beta hydrolase family)
MLVLTAAVLAASAGSALAAGGINQPSCVPSAAHPDPVVLLHGLGANEYEDLNFLQDALAGQGYCTFALTYGTEDGFPFVGGLAPIATSAAQIAQFVEQVKAETGAARVDLVGHSEGGFQSLYVTKTQGIAADIGRVVAIAPPTHGTSFDGLYDLASLLGAQEQAGVNAALSDFGCPACSDLVDGGAAVKTLDDGPIAQAGVTYTIIASRSDELVTPTSTAFVQERGVTNEYVQDACPLDPVGHIGEAYDLNVWRLVENALDPATATPIALCSFGAPF